MRPALRSMAFLFLAACTFVSSIGSAQQKESEYKTLSPYFFVKSDDPAIDRLPLKSTSASVHISGVIADVKVTQVYQNEGKHALEAIYVFPASTRAAVYAMKMTIGERTIHAKIKKRDEARQEYEQAKQQGKSASLLEQQRPNVFQMNVANIMPGDLVKVEMSYTELLVPTDKVYEFVYPTVVGPRYSNQAASTAPSSDKWVQNPYLHQGEAPDYSFDITVNISAGMPIQKLFCTSHKVDVHYQGNSAASVGLNSLEKKGGNRDYILRYQLSGEQVESGLLLYQGEKENFFLLMLQPPKRVTLAQIPGREYIFIVDVSGSMYGFPLEISKKLLKDLIGKLRPSDRFNVVLFAGGSTVMSESSVPANADNTARALNVIDNQHGGGGTELLPALKKALLLPKSDGFSRTVVIATDGYVSVEEEAFDLIRNNLDNANMFAFGIGSSVNRHIIEGMAHVGQGEPFVITKPEDAAAQAEAFRKLVQSPVLTRVKVDFGKFDVYDVEPASIPDVLADRPVIVFGKWRNRPEGTIMLSGLTGEQPYTDEINVRSVKPEKSNAALPYLWARQRITLLSDYNLLRSDDKRIKQVTDLGLTYNLLTAYTSFIAVDTEVRNKDGRSTTVNQPLPLPEGVSDHAVGGGIAGYAASPMVMRQTAAAPAQEVFKSAKSEDKALKEKASNPSPLVKIAKVTVSGGVRKEAVRSAMEHQLIALQACFQNMVVRGTFEVKLTIASNGSVKDVRIVSNITKSESIKQCLIDTIKGWKFHGSSDGKDMTATVVFTIGS